MTMDLRILLPDKPGELARLGEALGDAGINIEGVCGVPYEGQGVIHILVEDVVGARGALASAGIDVASEREVIVLDVVDEPGVLGSVTRKLADASINIELIYLATRTRAVIGVDDLAKARSIL